MTDAYTNASKLIASLVENKAQDTLDKLAQTESDVRHNQDTLPVVSNPEIVAWLRSLAPLSEQQIYNSSWKD